MSLFSRPLEGAVAAENHQVRTKSRGCFKCHGPGRDPRHIESFRRSAYGRGCSLRPDISLANAISGLEMACWNIVGKATEQPIHRLLGGRVHARLRACTYPRPEPEDGSDDVCQNPDLAATRALHHVEAGFAAVKFDPVTGCPAF